MDSLGTTGFECKAAGIPALFSETIPGLADATADGGARARGGTQAGGVDAVPRNTLSVVHTGDEYGEVDALVQKARMAQADGNVGQK